MVVFEAIAHVANKRGRNGLLLGMMVSMLNNPHCFCVSAELRQGL